MSWLTRSHKFSSKQQFIVTATIIGNALEWFDVTLFSLMAPLLISIFFPEDASFSATLYFVFIFIIIAIARPIGGIVFGYLGDRLGRKSALVKTIFLMIIPIFLVAILPSYKQVGVIATIALACILFFQGFTLGGEFPGSLVFLTESSPPKIKGYVGSWGYFGIFLGIFFAAVDIYFLSVELPLSEFEAWGWRLPFFLAGIIGIVSAFLRKLLHETTYFQKAKEFGYLVKEPILYALHKYKKMIAQGIGIFILDTVGFNLIILFSSSYFKNVLGLSYPQAFKVNLFTIAILLLFTPLMGKASVRVGCKRLARWASYGLLLAALPVYFLMSTKVLGFIYLGQGILGMLLAAYLSNLPALICSLFPPEVRYSGTSLAINFTIGLFGSAGPLLMTYLIIRMQTPILPGLYLMFGALVSLFTLSTIVSKAD